MIQTSSVAPPIARGGQRVALVGCGAIAEIFHLPALVRDPALRSGLVLVDPNTDRVRELGAQYGVTKHAPALDDVLAEVDAVVLAVPHHLHFPLAMRCIAAGVHVLSEKPLAEHPEEVRELAEASEARGVVVAVNNTRRLFPNNQRIKTMLDAGAIGDIRRIDFSQGEVFGWPLASGSTFGAAGSGKGVLLDVGAHVVDLVCWWLGTKPDLISFQDDSFGGSEAVCRLHARTSRSEVSVHLSWLSKLENVFRITGELGSIEGSAFDHQEFVLTRRDGGRETIRTTSGPRAYTGFGDVLVSNFLSAVRGEGRAYVSARDVLASVTLIAECYERRTRLTLPWFNTFGESICG